MSDMSDMIMVEGGAHLRPQALGVAGYKHAVVPIISASIALGKISVSNVPDIADPRVLAHILRLGGASCVWREDIMTIDSTNFCETVIPKELGSKIHGSIYLLPVILGRFGRVTLHPTGGCQIGSSAAGGSRPIAHMLSVLEAFGATFQRRGDIIEGWAEEFHGCDIDITDYSDRDDVLTGPLVSGATKTAILASLCVPSGRTTIHSPYPKPDVTELLNFIESYGVGVYRSESSVTIDTSERGRATYRPPRTPYQVISCLSEIMTYICLAVMQRLPLVISNIEPDKIRAGLREEFCVLERMGVGLRWGTSSLQVMPPERIRSVDIEVTSVGIYSDHQPFFALMLLDGDRPAKIREHVWKNRFDYAHQLVQAGARIEFGDHEITVHPSRLHATEQTLVGRDLRSAAVLMLAALQINGTTRIEGIHHLERGYPAFLSELRSLGGRFHTDDVANSNAA